MARPPWYSSRMIQRALAVAALVVLALLPRRSSAGEPDAVVADRLSRCAAAHDVHVQIVDAQRAATHDAGSPTEELDRELRGLRTTLGHFRTAAVVFSSEAYAAKRIDERDAELTRDLIAGLQGKDGTAGAQRFLDGLMRELADCAEFWRAHEPEIVRRVKASRDEGGEPEQPPAGTGRAP